MGQASSSSSAQPPQKDECVVCMSDIELDPKNNITCLQQASLKCRFNHHLCRGCAIRYINETWLSRPLEPGIVPEVECCSPRCGVVFREHQIAQVVDEETFRRYSERRAQCRDGMVLAEMRMKINDMDDEQLKDIAKADREVLARQLKLQLNNDKLLQCPQCNYGPIELHACGDLAAHHNQTIRSRSGNNNNNNSNSNSNSSGDGGAATAVSQINNSCPNCGWYTNTASQWKKWNGELLSTQDHKKNRDAVLQKQNASAALSEMAVASSFGAFVGIGVIARQAPVALLYGVASGFVTLVATAVFLKHRSGQQQQQQQQQQASSGTAAAAAAARRR